MPEWFAVVVSANAFMCVRIEVGVVRGRGGYGLISGHAGRGERGKGYDGKHHANLSMHISPQLSSLKFGPKA